MNTPVLDETALLVAARNGDRAAFGALVRLYQRRAYAAAYSIVGNTEDALEIAQEAFVRAFRAMDRFDTKMPFYPWLYRIIRNMCFNHLKRRQRRGEHSLDGMMATGFDLPCGERTPEEIAQFADLKRAIHEGMQGLTPDQQEILRLRHFLEMSYNEIAECLDIPAGTVMSRLHGARKSLRRLMEARQEGLVNI